MGKKSERLINTRIEETRASLHLELKAEFAPLSEKTEYLAKLAEERFKGTRKLELFYDGLKWSFTLALAVFTLLGLGSFKLLREMDEAVERINSREKALTNQVHATEAELTNRVREAEQRLAAKIAALDQRDNALTDAQQNADLVTRSFQITYYTDRYRISIERLTLYGVAGSSDVLRDVQENVKQLERLQKSIASTNGRPIAPSHRGAIDKLVRGNQSYLQVAAVLANKLVETNAAQRAIMGQQFEDVIEALKPLLRSETNGTESAKDLQRMDACNEILMALLLVRTYRQTGEPYYLNRAIQPAERAIELDPEFGKAHNTRGAIEIFRYQLAEKSGRPSGELAEHLAGASASFARSASLARGAEAISIQFNNLASVLVERAIHFGRQDKLDNAHAALDEAMRAVERSSMQPHENPMIIFTAAEIESVKIGLSHPKHMANPCHQIVEQLALAKSKGVELPSLDDMRTTNDCKIIYAKRLCPDIEPAYAQLLAQP